MTQKTTPQKILLATDMSARSDRALMRAAFLAKEWSSALAVAYAIEGFDVDAKYEPSWRRRDDAMTILERKTRAELQPEGMQDASLHICKGRPDQVVLSVAEKESCDFIVTGVARYELFGRVNVGETTDAVVRRAKSPVLVVKKRAVTPYKNILVATDFSEPSKLALQRAVSLFPAENITVFYAYNAPYADRVEEKDAYIHNLRKVEADEFNRFLKDTVGEDVARKLKILVEHGEVAELIAQYVVDKQVDLVVIGTHGRTGLSNLLLGSVAENIIASVPSDILVAR